MIVFLIALAGLVATAAVTFHAVRWEREDRRARVRTCACGLAPLERLAGAFERAADGVQRVTITWSEAERVAALRELIS